MTTPIFKANFTRFFLDDTKSYFLFIPPCPQDANLLNPSNFDKVLAQSELGYSQWKASLPVMIVSRVLSNDLFAAVDCGD